MGVIGRSNLGKVFEVRRLIWRRRESWGWILLFWVLGYYGVRNYGVTIDGLLELRVFTIGRSSIFKWF